MHEVLTQHVKFANAVLDAVVYTLQTIDKFLGLGALPVTEVLLESERLVDPNVVCQRFGPLFH